RGGICPYTARLAGLQPGIGRLAQRESAALTQQRSLVRSQHRPPDSCNATAPTRALACPGMPRSFPGPARVIYDCAVVIPTILRPVLARAVRSVYAQDFPGSVQVLVGIDVATGSRG